MADRLNIPEELKDSHQRLMGMLPVKLREDRKMQKAVLVFIKFGGETLARNHIEIRKILHLEETLRKNGQLEEAAFEETLASDDTEYKIDSFPVEGVSDSSADDENDDEDDEDED